MVAASAEGLRIVLRDPAPVPHLKKTLDMLGRGGRPIHIVVEMDRYKEIELALDERYSINAQGRAAIKSIPGVVEVQDL